LCNQPPRPRKFCVTTSKEENKEKNCEKKKYCHLIVLWHGERSLIFSLQSLWQGGKLR